MSFLYIFDSLILFAQYLMRFLKMLNQSGNEMHVKELFFVFHFVTFPFYRQNWNLTGTFKVFFKKFIKFK